MKPCIRGLKEFKKGCPENSSCPAWIETLGKQHPAVVKKCADIVRVDLLWDLNCNMIGIQQATESSRNHAAKNNELKALSIVLEATGKGKQPLLERALKCLPKQTKDNNDAST